MTNKYNVLISYDVDDKQDAVKAKLKSLGYSDSFNYKGEVVKNYLPQTTLWKGNHDTTTAKNDVITVCQQLSVKLERFVATAFEQVTSIPGEPYKS